MTPAIQPTASPLTLVPLPPAETDTSSLTPAKQPPERHLTITPRSLPRGRGYVNVPQLILRGLYLEKTGFNIGDKVTVIQRRGQLIIHRDDIQPEIPAITTEDKTLARKLGELKRFTENTAGERLPCAEDLFADYLRDDLPPVFQKVMSAFLNGYMPKRLRQSVIKLLNSDLSRENKEVWAEGILSGAANAQAQDTKESPRERGTTTIAKKVVGSLPANPPVLSPSHLQVAEPSANPQVGEYPQICGLDPGRNYIRNVLQTMKCPPPPRDPAAGPTMREILDRTGDPAIPPEDYPEIPARFREFYTADELEIYDACRQAESLTKVDK